ncbi:MAG: DUF4124 domain-containing protein [Gammaproteobacteria bacterium]|jgi:hypothetical protein|nr:DUF4124 domain-containing protein [Gammaproteobacteria bacterium]MBQ0774822.1 DUF4124 domain-containing protein [Gammaproteobacteria bacterium]
MDVNHCSYTLPRNLGSALSAAFCIASLLYAGTSIAADSIYKWQDEKGVTHYSQSPPEDKAAAVETVKTSIKASSDQEQELEQLKQSRQKEMKRMKEEAGQPATPEKKSEKSLDEARAERCAQNQKNLNTLRNQPVVRVKDPETGELAIVDADQRQKMINDATSALTECN